MSIVNVRKKYSGRVGSDEEGRRTIEEAWTVLVDTLDANPWDVVNAIDPTSGDRIPRRFDPHSPQSDFYADQIRITDQKGMLFTVTVTYLQPSGGTGTPTPWTEPVEISGNTSTVTEPIDQSADGLAIINSAGQRFAAPMSDEFGDRELTFARNDLSIDYDLLAAYDFAINSDTFFGFAPGRCKMRNIYHERRRFGTIFYYHKRYTIAVRKPKPVVTQANGVTIGGAARSWYRRVLDQGYNYWLSSDPQTQQRIMTPALDELGNPVSEAVLLDGFGAPSDTPIWAEFRSPANPLLPFSALGII